MLDLLFEMAMVVIESLLNGMVLLFPLGMAAYIDRHYAKQTRSR